MVVMAMTAAIPMMMPSMVRKVRSLLAIRDRQASVMFSPSIGTLPFTGNPPVHEGQNPTRFLGHVLTMSN